MRGICGSVFGSKQQNCTQSRSKIPRSKYIHKPTQSDSVGGSGICVFFPPTPPIYIRLKGRSQIPPCECATRGSVGGWCWGSYLTPTTTFGSRRKRHPKARVRSTRSRCSSTEAKTKNEEGKTKMSTIREVVEMAFAAGHAAGVVDAADEREAEVPIGDLRSDWFVQMDRLTRDAEQMLGKGH